MAIENIQAIVARGEGVTVEFKKTTGQLERGMETLCAFLNGEGGTVFFGVHDNGRITGQEVADTTKKDIAEALARFEPSVSPDISYVPIPDSDKFVIAVKVNGERFRRPFFYKNTAYRRVQSTTSPMPQDMLQDMMMIRGGKEYVWESLAAEGMTMADIDTKLLLGAVNLGIFHNRLPESVATQSVEDMLRGFKLFTLEGRLNNAAMVLFGKNLLNYPQCLLRLAKFNGTSKLDDFIDNQRVEGNIYELLDAAMSFFAKHLNISGRINPVTWQREDELPIPRKALREAVINACAHRLYHRRGSSISVAIYTDRIEVANTGAYPVGITPENIERNDESEPMNPIIANVLFRTSYLEHWGRGIRMMIDECVSRGLKAPTFTTDGHSVKTTFFLPSESNVQKGSDNLENVIDNLQNDLDSPRNDVETSGNDLDSIVNDSELNEELPKIEKRRRILLSLLESKPQITTAELTTLLRVSLKTVSRDIAYLTKQSKLSREGGDFGGHWVVHHK